MKACCRKDTEAGALRKLFLVIRVYFWVSRLEEAGDCWGVGWGESRFADVRDAQTSPDLGRVPTFRSPIRVTDCMQLDTSLSIQNPLATGPVLQNLLGDQNQGLNFHRGAPIKFAKFNAQMSSACINWHARALQSLTRKCALYRIYFTALRVHKGEKGHGHPRQGSREGTS